MKIQKSKRSILKAKKQQLCDRINQAKSLKELKGWEKTFSYHSVLKDDFDWDYSFLFDLLKFKLKRMREYFWTHNILENEHQSGNICNTLINLIDAGYSTEIVTEEELKGKYVNTRNVHRFLTPKQLDFILKENLRKYYLPTIREVKAKKLFWKYLEHNIEILWE